MICLLMLVHTTDISAIFLEKVFHYGTPFPSNTKSKQNFFKTHWLINLYSNNDHYFK